MNNKDSLLVILLAGIGDLVLASKSIRALKKGHPDSELHLLTTCEAAPIARNYKFIDKVWEIPMHKAKGNKLFFLNEIPLLFKLRRCRFNKIVNLYLLVSLFGSLKMGLLFLLIGSKLRIGYGSKGFKLFLTHRISDDIFNKKHIVDAMLDIAILAGGISDNVGIECFWNANVESKWDHLFTRNKTEQYKLNIGINPGGAKSFHFWDLEKFVLLANRLVNQTHTNIFILGGNNDISRANYISTSISNSHFNLVAKTSLNDLIYVISKLDLVITTDSAPMHIAAALGTPIVAIFGPANYRMYGPYNSKQNYTIVDKELPCKDPNIIQCKMRFKCTHLSCINNINVDDVFDAACKYIPRNLYIHS